MLTVSLNNLRTEIPKTLPVLAWMGEGTLGSFVAEPDSALGAAPLSVQRPWVLSYSLGHSLNSLFPGTARSQEQKLSLQRAVAAG